MRPVLFEIAGPSPLVYLALFLLVAAGTLGWMLWLRRKQALTRDHLFLGAAIVVMAAVLLFLLHRAGHIRVNAYGAMLMLGFIGGTLTAVRLGIRRGIPADRFVDLGLIVLICAIIGARWAYVAITPNAGPFLDVNRILQDGLGGLSFHGGLLGGWLGGSLYLLAARLPYWRVADCVAPGIALGYAVTRIGCFLNGCCYGKPAVGLPWAMTFLKSPDGQVFDVHPTQLYASGMGFLIVIILLLLSRGKSLGRAGRLFMVFLMLQGVERFVMEIYRQPDPQFAGLFTPAQWVSLLLFAAGLVALFVLPKRDAVDTLRPPTSSIHRDRSMPTSS